MRKLLLLVSVTLLGIAGANAQCTPDAQYTSPGIYPDSATGFASACVDQYYEQLITVVVPVDTTTEVIPGFPVTLAFDSIVIVDFQGLPPSMNLSYACWSSLGSNCAFPGGGTGCTIISGTPTSADLGVHNLVITVDVYVGGLSSPQAQEVIDWYYIDVQNCTTGLNEAQATTAGLYPNPAENTIHLEGISSDNVMITDINGQIMMQLEANGTSAMEVNVSGLTSGVYFVRMGDETIRFVKK